MNVLSVSVGEEKKIIFDRPYFMGILNVTSDSFYDGGKYKKIDMAIKQVQRLLDEGADIIDIGGASSRPGAIDVGLDVELNRVLPIIESIRKVFPDILLSIDTFKEEVAYETVNRGVDIINDISGGEYSNGKTMKLAIDHKIPIVLMHRLEDSLTMQNNVKYENVVLEIYNYLQRRVKEFVNMGGDRSQVIIDPGLGFGKFVNHNIEILKNIEYFTQINNPVLIGISMKKTIGEILNYKNVEDRKYGNIGINLSAINNGCHIIRVHHVKEIRDAYICFEAIRESLKLEKNQA